MWRWATSSPSPRPARHRVNLLFALVQAGRLDEAEARGRALVRGRRPGSDAARRDLARRPPGPVRARPGPAGHRAAMERPGVHRHRRLRPRGAAAGGLRRCRPSPTASSATPPPAPRASRRGRRAADRVRVPRPRTAARTGVGAGRRRCDPRRSRSARWRPPTTPSAPATCPPRRGCSTTPPASAPRPPPPAASPPWPTMTDSALVAARAEHAAALVAGDGARLAAAAERFEALGALAARRRGRCRRRRRVAAPARATPGRRPRRPLERAGGPLRGGEDAGADPHRHASCRSPTANARSPCWRRTASPAG